MSTFLEGQFIYLLLNMKTFLVASGKYREVKDKILTPMNLYSSGRKNKKEHAWSAREKRPGTASPALAAPEGRESGSI